MDFKILFFITLQAYFILAIFLTVRAFMEEPMRRSEIIIGFVAFMLSIYALGYYFEVVSPQIPSINM